MGSGASKKHAVLKCPDGFDNEKFKKICVLFDKLDQDSNFGVSSDELTDIADLHVKNCQRRLEARLQAASATLEHKLTDTKRNEEREVARVRTAWNAERQRLSDDHQKQADTLRSKMEWYESMDADGRADAFMRAVMPRDKDHIDFWTFFEYMKTRTDDIKNIKD